jgi:hypothetical protein
MSNRTEDLARYAALIARLRQGRPEWLVGYAPVSEATVRAAEQRMGYRLPPFLRWLYTQVGNGGFGPGKGFTLMGIDGGTASRSRWFPGYDADDPARPRTLEDVVPRGGPEHEEGWDLPAEVEQALLRHPYDYVVFPCGTSRMATVEISTPSGGLEWWEMDLRTGRIFWRMVTSYASDLEEGAGAMPPGHDCLHATSCYYASLEEFFEQQLAGNAWPTDLDVDGTEHQPQCLGMARPQGFVSFVPFGLPRTVALWERLLRGDLVSRRELTMSTMSIREPHEACQPLLMPHSCILSGPGSAPNNLSSLPSSSFLILHRPHPT